MARRHVLSLLTCIIASGCAPAQLSQPLTVGQVPGPVVVVGPGAQLAQPATRNTPYIIAATPSPAAPPVQLPSPAAPMAGVTLPRDRSGDGAYNGGGVVLEQDGRGVTRQLR